MEVFTCKIKQPSIKHIESLCIRNDTNKQELSTSGYIRQCWNMKQFKDIRYPPAYLIKIIERYVCFEIIHYMNSKAHWMINVDDIINNIEDD